MSERAKERVREMDMIINIISIILCIFILNMCEKVAAMRQLVVYSIEFDVFVPFSFSYSFPYIRIFICLNALAGNHPHTWL